MKLPKSTLSADNAQHTGKSGVDSGAGREPASSTPVRLENGFHQFGDSVALINMNTLMVYRAAFAHDSPGLVMAGCYPEIFELIQARTHPDDRKRMDELRSPSALSRAYFDKWHDIPCDYRLLLDNEYIWISSRLFFTDDKNNPQAVIVARNIMQEKTGLVLSPYTPVFSEAHRETYTEIYELDIQQDIPTLLFANESSLIPLTSAVEHSLYGIVRELVHPDDRKKVLNLFGGDNLRSLFAAGQEEGGLEFRRRAEGGQWLWVYMSFLALHGQGGISKDKAMLYSRDISKRKEEEQRHRILEQYDRALRSIYDEVYELNVSQNSYRILYQVDSKYVSPEPSGVLEDTVRHVGQHMVHPLDRKRFNQFFDIVALRERFARGEEFCIGEFRKLWVDGWFHWASLTLFPVSNGIATDETYLVFVMDIDARKRSEEIAQQNALLEQQRLADERYKIIVEQTNTLVFEWTKDFGTCYVSPGLSQRFAGVYDGRDIMTVWKDDGVVHPEDMGIFESFLLETRTEHHVEMITRLRRRDNSYIWCKIALSCLHDDDQNTTRYVGTLNDVDDATRSELALRYRAEYDTLTGICNMQTFYSRASHLMRAFPESQYYVIRMDIDRFKVINDLYGMEEGDRLLKTIARMLNECMSERSVCGRISGDVFCACVDYSREKILQTVSNLAEKLSQYPLTSRVVPSFGICRVDNAVTPINVLCDWANLALKTVKGNVLQFYAFYDETLREHILSEKKIESEMHSALQDGEFCLYLQPKVDINTSRIVGAEALVRWHNPLEGVVEPNSFIPLFEKNGFIIRLDEFIWEEACKVLRDWIDNGNTPLPLSVNVSRMHIHDTRFCEKLPRLVAKYSIPPHLLELELTESVFLDNADRLVEAINELRQYGFLFSLDDFGAGYSSLNMLKSLPIETIKIDRGFLNEVVATDRGKTVIQHIISLAKALHMQIVAEGVENADQADFLLGVGCALAQGYYYSRPVPVAEFEKLAFGQSKGVFLEEAEESIFRRR